MSDIDAVDLFAGPGGWDLAARDLGLRVVGVENDDAACATRAAAGLETVKGDVRMLGPDMFPTARLLIASPPCQTFSTAGTGEGRKQLFDITRLARSMAARERVNTSGLDELTALVLEPLRWALEALDAGQPYETIALEQVVGVLPVWETIARALRAEGYAVVTGLLRAEQFGVPQTRKRAILLARRQGGVAMPKPTHSRYHQLTPERLDRGVLPWVSMAETLGWLTYAGEDAGRGDVRTHLREELGAEVFICATNRRSSSTMRSESQPAPTMAFGKGAARWIVHPDDPDRVEEVKLTAGEAAALQSFPDNYPFEGTAYKVMQQISNAVPPAMARAILEHLLATHVVTPAAPARETHRPPRPLNAELAELATLASARSQVEAGIVQHVAAARAAGASWIAVGEQLGVSKQAAQKRYG